MIEWSRIEELREEIGEEDFEEVVEIFLEEVEDVIALLREGVPDDQLESHLHFLKGSALNLGFKSFSGLCQTGETAAAQGYYGEIDLSDVVSSYELSKTEFLSTLANRPAA